VNIVRHFDRGTRYYLLITFSEYTYNVGLRTSVSESVQRSHNSSHHETRHQGTPDCHLSEQSQTCQENISFSIIQAHTEDHDGQESASIAILEGHRRKSSTPDLRRSTNTATDSRGEARLNSHATDKYQDSQARTS